MRATSSGVSDDLQRAQRFRELRARARADERHDRRALRKDPRDGELRGGDPLRGCQFLQRLDQALIALAVVSGEARQIRAEIAA